MVSRLLYLEPGQLKRCWPFFVLYFFLFTALTLADALSLTLFVQNVGTRLLPHCYAISSAFVLIGVTWYLRSASKYPSQWVFWLIMIVPLCLFMAVWVIVTLLGGHHLWYGLLFIGREIAFALVVLHFGTYLQDYFTRAELNRVMPLIYAGGRVGGILGGVLLEYTSPWIPPSGLLPVTAGLIGVGMVGVAWITRHRTHVEEPTDVSLVVERKPKPPGNEGAVERGIKNPSETDLGEAPTTWRGLMAFVWSNPLLFWISVTTILYFGCRAFLNFQYSVLFEEIFDNEAEMARFLGRYTQWALIGSLFLQLFVINRWIAFAGLKGAHMTYAALLLMACLAGSVGLTLATAMFARLIENELRYGLRNPVSQMIVNLFPKPQRICARAWSLGFLIPVATLVSSVVLAVLVRWELSVVIGVIVALLGFGYLTASVGLIQSFREISPPGFHTWRSRKRGEEPAKETGG
ncbi:MAG: hypothetical protein WDZ51_11475 [Pirellulaceae bacterium]